MIPFGNQTVTLIRRIENKDDGKTSVSFKRTALTGCSWRMKTIWQQVGTEMQRGTEITCRIPPGQIAPNVGDYLFLGNVRADISSISSLNAAIAAHRETGVMRAASVSNHTIAGNPIPHYAVRGDLP